MDDPKLEFPAYQITLNADELALFGYFSAVWGQLDYWTGMTIAALLNTEITAAETLMEGASLGGGLRYVSVWFGDQA